MLFKFRSLLSDSSAAAVLTGLALCSGVSSAQSDVANVFLRVEEPLSIGQVSYYEPKAVFRIQESQNRFDHGYELPLTMGAFEPFELLSDELTPSPSRRRLELGFDKFGNRDGVVLFGHKSPRGVRRRLAGLRAAHFSDSGKHLMLRTSRLIELHVVEELSAESMPLLVVDTTGDFHFAEDSRFFILTHDGAIELYDSKSRSGKPLWRMATEGFAIGAKLLKSGELIFATRRSVEVFRDDGAGGYQQLSVYSVDDPNWELRSLSVAPQSGTNSSKATRRIAVGMRRVLTRPTMLQPDGLAKLRVRVFGIPSEPGELVDVLETEELETLRWSFASPGITWLPDGFSLAVHSRDTAWSVELP